MKSVSRKRSSIKNRKSPRKNSPWQGRNGTIIILLLVGLFTLAISLIITNRRKSIGNNPGPGLSECLEESKRYTIDEALENKKVCDIEIKTDADLNKLAYSSDQLANVRSIYLRKTPNTTVPPEIADLSNLKILNFHHTFNTEIPEEIGQLTSLTDLVFNQSDITGLPESIGDLSNLESLSITDNTKEFTLPDVIGNLTKLRVLSLGYNPKVNLPESLIGSPAITELDLTETGLEGVPALIYQLDSLRILNLSNNNLTELSERLDQLENLDYLVLSGNNLTDDQIDEIRRILPETEVIF